MPDAVRRRDYLAALLLWAASAAALGLAQRDVGVMRDEATYFQAGERYWGWFEALSDTIVTGKAEHALSAKAVERFWATNSEHPVLCKVLFGLSWRALHGYDGGKRGPGFHPNSYPRAHKSLDLLSEISAFRLPGWLFTGLAVALLYLFGVRYESRAAGLAAGLLYITLPHVFFHGQLACFDSPIATMWLAVVYAYLRALERARWGILAGLIFGLALATKHNAWFVPAVLLVHYLIVVWPDVTLRPLRPPRVPLVFLAMAALGPLVFYAHWPWLWFDTVRRLKDYFNFHLHHSFYNIEYLGQNIAMPPLPVSYPFVMTLFTVPLVTLVLGLGGLWVYARPAVLERLSRLIAGVRPPPADDRFRYPARRSWLRPAKGLDPRLGTLLLLNVLVPLVVIALPSTPKFGGTKHWLPAYPFLALLAGVALARLLATARARLGLGRALTTAVLLLTPVPGALNAALSHPFGLTQYNALAGGPAGGADLGLVRQFWGYSSRQILPTLNSLVGTASTARRPELGTALRAAPPGGVSPLGPELGGRTRVYFHDTSHDAYGAYIRDGLLRPAIANAGMERPAIEASTQAMVMHELHFNKYDYWIWAAYGSGAPVKVLHLDGVPVISLYSRKPLPASAATTSAPPPPARGTPE